MIYGYVKEILPDDKYAQEQMDSLLKKEGILRDHGLSCSVGIWSDDGDLIATGSLLGNTLRCMAVDSRYRGEGLLVKIVTYLIEMQAKRGITHLFIYTKYDSADYFKSLGFYEITRVDHDMVFLENQRNGFKHYLHDLEQQCGVYPPGAALVMNANPFTLGHKKLLERASAENDRVVLFLLSEENTLVPYIDRLSMACAAAKDFSNVQVVSSGSYIISAATFPSYFLKSEDHVVKTHAKLDANLFVCIAKALNITRRYVGEEPFSQTTALYNDILSNILPPNGIELRVVSRTKVNGIPISASRVRQLIHSGKLEDIRDLVPDSTYAYLKSPKGESALKRIRAVNNVIHH